MSSTPYNLTLSNGLQVSLRHAPHLKRCAAVVRVHAGSHDAPSAYPGLAHFLEHLFFLGTERFPVEDGLMRFVQREGGQLNASTGERTTTYFFEVAPAAMAGALERLCEMLAHPLLTLERQRAEREVIHAEWVAWSANAEAQRQYALLRSVSARHPLSGFHAGNRDSLPVDDPAFQQALGGFHQRFYQAGQITLSLSGPQSLDELEQWARQFGALLATGSRVAQQPPPPLLDGSLQPPQIDGQLDLLFAHEDAAEGANEYLATWISDASEGGLVNELRRRGWLESFSFTPLYAFSRQALLHAELRLSATADVAKTEELVRDWLAFFSAADHRELMQDYQRLQDRRGSSALELARRSTAQPTVLMFPGVSRHPWKLPEPEPLLNAVIAQVEPSPVPAGLVVSPVLPASRHYAVLYLRWQFEDQAGHLRDALKPLIERASRAAVDLQWTRTATTWQLRCAGHPAPVLAVVEQALAMLDSPAPAHPINEPALIPIRELMQQLPHALLTPGTPGWTALSTGFDAAGQNALNCLLTRIISPPSMPPAPLRKTAQWLSCVDAGDEQALLLFSPVDDEASGRLLAQLIQGPFYQRLRSELQLGYAVFTAFRQVQGHNGLMFGVQSPGASHAEILGHLKDFFARPAPLIDVTREVLAGQFHEPTMANAELAEWLWQAHLAGHDNADPERLAAGILKTGQADIDRLWAQLSSGESWLILANGADPR